MHIQFIDLTRDFGISTPLREALGGTQSAICYLAQQLVAFGHKVSIVNATPETRLEEGVRFQPWNTVILEGGVPETIDVVIVVAAPPEMIATWRQVYGSTPLWLMWVHHDIDQPAVAGLNEVRTRGLFDYFLFVSEWQARAFHDAMGIGWDRAFVLRNGVGPIFLDRIARGQEILPLKSPDPLFAYTSTPYRGLDCLLDAIPLVRAQIPEARFKIFSSWKVYGYDQANDPHQDIYQRCRDTEGVDYIGGVSQTRLSEELVRAWGLAYPNTFNETSCIAVMEALATGGKVITTHRAALPETAANLAQMVVNPQNERDLVQRFAGATIDVIRNFRSDPARTETELQGAAEHARRNFSWKQRAEQLLEWLNGRLASRNALGVGLPSSLQMVSARRGKFLINRNDVIIGNSLSIYGEWAEPEAALLCSLLRPDDVVLDIGAHIGTEAVPMAKAVGPGGRVHAFEPQGPIFRLLEANLALNDAANTLSYRTLVGARDGEWGAAAVDYAHPANFGAVSFRQTEDGDDRTPMVRIDTLFANLPHCRLIKIDVEGMEPDVLKGAADLIARCRPIIYCEAVWAEQFDEVQDFLVERNYVLHWHCFPGFNPANYFGYAEDLFNGFGDSNLLCLPRESGLFSDLPTALLFEDLDLLYPGLRPGPLGRSHRSLLPPSLLTSLLDPPSNRSKNAGDDDDLHKAFLARTDAVPFLRLHRDIIERRHFGFGDRSSHAVWLDLLRALAGEHRHLRLLEIGVFRGQTLSLWGLIGKILEIDVALHGVSPFDGSLTDRPELLAENAPQPSEMIADSGPYIRNLFDIFALSTRNVRLLSAKSGTPGAADALAADYHLVYLDGDPGFDGLVQDIARYGAKVVAGGFLVIGDPAVEMPGWFRADCDDVVRARKTVDPSLFEPLATIGHLSLYRRRTP